MMNDGRGDDTLCSQSAGISDEARADAGDRVEPGRSLDASTSGQGNALSSGLQSGGVRPGGGPGAMMGSIGTGGGANDNQATGDAARNNIEEEQL
jgi:hypothetical protein